ncbi:MAG: phospholipid carrier-dependent glycosyltransferase, partial [Nitrospina sp.]|nr:phospholipid carrier-dependent glycosyltransferase [Nitrospina sp.]
MKRITAPFKFLVPDKTDSTHFFLFAIISWVLGSNIIWMILDIRPPEMDQSLHMRQTFHYWQALTSGAKNWWIDVLNVEPFYPPFFHLSMIPFALIFGFTLDAGLVGSSLYLIVSILSIYGIGKILYNKTTGLIAAFLLSCFPIVLIYSRFFMISLMLTAMVSLSYYLFLKSNNLEDKKYSFLFSLVYASGLMIKWTFLIYTLPAILIGLFAGSHSFKDRITQLFYYSGMITALLIFPFIIYVVGEMKWIPLCLESLLILSLVKSFPRKVISHQKALNLIALTCVCVLICFPWYAHNFINISIGMSKFGFPTDVLKGQMDWPLPIWGYYLEIAGRQMGIPVFLGFLVAFVLFIFKNKQQKSLLLGWVIFSLLIFTLINNKGDRYTLPVLPAMALIMAVVMVQIKRQQWRKFFYLITGVSAIITAIYSGFFSTPMPVPFLGAGYFFGPLNPPSKAIWPVDRILNDIILTIPPTNKKVLTVRTLTNHGSFHRGAFRDTAEFRELPIIMKSVKRNVGEMTDFFITKTGDFGKHAFKDINPKLTRLLENPALTKTFTPFKAYSLPDGSQGLVLKKAIQPANDLTGVKNLDQVGSLILTALESYPIYGIKNAVNPTISIIATANPEDIFLGRYKQIKITADSAVSNKIILTDFELIFDDVQINIYDLILNNKFILFELGKLTPKGTLSFDALEKLAYKAMREKGTVKIEGSDNGLLLHATYNLPQGQTVEGSAKIKLLFTPGERIKPVVEFIKLGPLDIPSIFFRRITDANIVLT